jgi:uncharacterized protein
VQRIRSVAFACEYSCALRIFAGYFRPDMTASKKFYAKCFGWKFIDYGPDYSGIKSANGGEIGGLCQVKKVKTGGTLVIFYSMNLNITYQKINAAGGTIVKPIFEFPGGQRFHFADPSGNVAAVWKAK